MVTSENLPQFEVSWLGIYGIPITSLPGTKKEKTVFDKIGSCWNILFFILFTKGTRDRPFIIKTEYLRTRSKSLLVLNVNPPMYVTNSSRCWIQLSTQNKLSFGSLSQKSWAWSDQNCSDQSPLWSWRGFRTISDAGLLSWGQNTKNENFQWSIPQKSRRRFLVWEYQVSNKPECGLFDKTITLFKMYIP